MGACEFQTTAKGKTFQEAFINARDDAAYENGHGGYTGTIAEKHKAVELLVPAGVRPQDFILDCMKNIHHPCQDKWGPAHGVKTGSDEWTFFGWASS